MERLERGGVVLLRENDETAIYVCGSMRLTLSTTPVGGPLEDFAGSMGLPTGDVAQARRQPNQVPRQAMLPLFFDPTPRTRAASRIGRLTVNISNACNLRCRYCYADHGRYDSALSLMSVERASAIVEKLIDYYSEIDAVQLFGGEPFLNVPAIDAIGGAFKAAAASGRLKHRPSMTVTTNGTLSTPRVMEAIKRWQLSPMVSWDGPQPIHDKARPTQAGRSSFRAVRRTIDRFQSAAIPFEIECTYHSRHVEAGISVADLMQYFYDTAGITRVHIPPVSPPPLGRRPAVPQDHVRAVDGLRLFLERETVSSDKLVELYREASRLTVDHLFSGKGPTLAAAVDIVERLATRSPVSSLCPAYSQQLSVAEDGCLYPCFMFIGHPDFNMGNLLTDAFPSDRSLAVLTRYLREHCTEPSCSAGWYQGLSGGCVAGDFAVTGKLITRDDPIRRAMVEECLLGVARNWHGVGRNGDIQSFRSDRET